MTIRLLTLSLVFEIGLFTLLIIHQAQAHAALVCGGCQ